MTGGVENVAAYYWLSPMGSRRAPVPYASPRCIFFKSQAGFWIL
jgi:hypothetical protein